MNRRHFAGCILPFVFGAPLLLGESKKADLSRLVVIGDSLSAGFQNFSLLETQQVHSYAAIIAGQAKTEMVLPRVKFPGVPNVLQLKAPGPPPLIVPVAEPPLLIPELARSNPLGNPTNLAVPGASISEVLNKRPAPLTPASTVIDLMTNIVLDVPAGTPQSQVERAVSMKPTTVLLWAGNNDVLLPELIGDLRLLTFPASFFLSLDKIMQALSGTGASVVVANIPDVTAAPYFISAETIATQAGIPVADVRSALGLNPGDKIRPAAQPLVPGILQNPTTGPLPKMCPPIPGEPVLPGLPFTQVPCVFRNSEAQVVRAYVAVFNAIILAEATFRHATLVDIHSLFDDLNDDGYTVSGRHLTADFLGGLVTLDGMHPTNTLHAIIANEFIDTMNDKLKTKIPRVSVEQVAKTDPLIFPPIQ